MIIETSNKIEDFEIEDFLEKTNENTFYSSVKHIRFLEKILENECKFIIAKDNSKLLGILPYFEKNSNFGKVINSLPFFGSYGGIISENNEATNQIIDFYNNFIDNEEIISSVIIDNPFHNNQQFEKKIKHNVIEKRLIQSTSLEKQKIEEVFTRFEKRVRWSIKKAEKYGIRILCIDDYSKHIENFYKLHKNSMDRKNGRSKPENLFSKIMSCFKPGIDFDIFTATKDEKPIAYVLVFYYKKFCEYYLPAYDPNYLDTQATSLLIWESMKKSFSKGITEYNFGGTWINQVQLYRFKRGWNSRDLFYNYYIFRDKERINQIGIEKILKEFSNFYICPFDQI